MIPGEATSIRQTAIIADFIGIERSKYSHFIGFPLHRYAIRNGGRRNVAVVCRNWNHFSDATDVLSGISAHRAKATMVNNAIQSSHCMDLTKTDESLYFPCKAIYLKISLFLYPAFAHIGNGIQKMKALTFILQPHKHNSSEFVGMTRFELATSGPPDRCATGLRHIPIGVVFNTLKY